MRSLLRFSHAGINEALALPALKRSLLRIYAGAPTVNRQHGIFSILRGYRFGTRVGMDQVRHILER
jgi:hypothetical protein